MRVFFTFICLLLCVSAYGQPSFCLRLVQIDNDGNSLVMKLEIQGDVSFKLGSSNLQFSYNDEAIDKPIIESTPLAPPFYQVPTLTVPSKNQLSFNIELGFAGFGATMAGSGAWTEIARVRFDIIDFTKINEMTWTYNGGTTATVVFLDDEATQIFATTPSCLASLTPTSSPLPGDLLDFFGKPTSNVVELDWITANEENVAGFEILRSKNGKNWEKIGWMDAKENVYNTYQFIDDSPFSPYNYYLLNMVDHDGTSKLSDIIIIPFGSNEINVFPNPSRGFININLGNFDGPFEVEVYDASERLKFKTTTANKRIDLSNLSSGTYILLLKVDHQLYTSKFVKI